MFPLVVLTNFSQENVDSLLYKLFKKKKEQKLCRSFCGARVALIPNIKRRTGKNYSNYRCILFMKICIKYTNLIQQCTNIYHSKLEYISEI